MPRILIVDDDHVQVDVVSFLLRREGLDPIAAFDVTTAARLFTGQEPDLVILDVQLGDADGRDLLRQFREQRPEVSILMLTALAAEDDRVHGLELGADDYLTKPFGHRELVARVRALLRRATAEPYQPRVSTLMRLGSVSLDPGSREVTRNGRRLDLSPTEFRLLQTLLESPDQLVSTRALLKSVWGHQDMTARNVLRVTASRLRAKLQVDPSSAPVLQTVPGQGLMIRNDEVPVAPRSLTEPPNQAESPVDMNVVGELQDLLAGTGDHPLQQLYEVFVKSAEEHLQAMRDAFARGDGVALARDAHRLRGNGASMGARRVSRLCAMVEERSRADDLDPVGDLLVQLDEELTAYEEAIEPILD
jgi:DNA-binding response OmpR family regulator/HPt (histidine-containing phosphotransfer) domain-containing protein